MKHSVKSSLPHPPPKRQDIRSLHISHRGRQRLRRTTRWTGLLLRIISSGLTLAQTTGRSPAATTPPERDSLEQLRTAPPQYHILRAQDNFSYLADGAIRNDFFDPIKYIPFGKSKTVYLSLGGEIRQWYQVFRHEAWGDAPQDDDGFWLQRYMGHASLQLGPHLRFFGQWKNGTLVGRKGGPRPQIDKDELGLHQGFVDLTAALGAGNFTLRLGRQEFLYGAERLITMREGQNLRLSFDAVKGSARWPRTRVDAFVAQPVLIGPYTQDDRRNEDETVWAVYSVNELPGRQSYLDLYYIGQQRNQAAYNQGVAFERRHTLGARLWNRAAPFRYDVEVIGQAGRFGQGDIRAFLVATEVSYAFASPRKPTLGFSGHIISGDEDPTDADLQTFNPLYPRPFFGVEVPIGPSNLLNAHPTVQTAPSKAMTLRAGANFLWQYSTRDGLYSPAVMQSRPLPPSPTERAHDQTILSNANRHYTGVQWTLDYVYQITPHLNLMVDLAYFPTGPYLEATGPANDLFYSSGQLTFRF